MTSAHLTPRANTRMPPWPGLTLLTPRTQQSMAPMQMPEIDHLQVHQLPFQPAPSEWLTVPARGCSSIAGELVAARDLGERMRLIHGMLRIIGFTHLSYVTLHASGERISRATFLDSAAPAHLDDAYFSQGHYLIDPRLQTMADSGMPVVWDIDHLCANLRGLLPTQRVRDFLSSLHGAMAHSGFMLRVPIANAPLQVLISFAAPHRDREWMTDAVFGQALMLACALHQSICTSVRLALREDDASLSSMQQRILACLASGMSDKEIAQRLHTTTHNVDYHLRFLRKRYAASNRTELAYAAGRLGLV